MALQIQGNSGIVQEVDSTYRAAHTTPRPTEHATLGQYRLATVIPIVVSQGSNSTLLSFRWTDASRFAVIQFLRLQCLQTSAATATIWPYFEVFVARGFTVVDSSGTAIVFSGNNMKTKTSQGTTLLGDLRVSAASGGVSAGTRTLDAQPILQLPTTQIITTPGAVVYQAQSVLDGNPQHPEVLAQNEGLIVRGPSTAFGVAGTANLHVDIAWAEVTSY